MLFKIQTHTGTVVTLPQKKMSSIPNYSYTMNHGIGSTISIVSGKATKSCLGFGVYELPHYDPTKPITKLARRDLKQVRSPFCRRRKKGAPKMGLTKGLFSLCNHPITENKPTNRDSKYPRI